MGVLKFVARILKSRWFGIVGGIFLCCISSCMYDFSVYSQSLKSNLGYSQDDLELVATFKDLGACVVFISGVLYDLQPPWIVVSFGAVEGLIGYLMLWLSVSNVIEKPAVWQTCIYMGLAANASATLVLASVITCLKNFPNRRGTVSGILKGSLGLGAAFLIQIYETLYGGNSTSFLLLISWLLPIVALAFMFTLRPIDSAVNDPHEEKYLIMFIVLIAALAVELLAATLLENFVEIGRFWQRVSSLILCGTLVLSIGVVVTAELQTTQASSGLWSESSSLLDNRISVDNVENKAHLLEKDGQNYVGEPDSDETDGVVVETIFSRDEVHASPRRKPDPILPQRGDSFTFLQALQSLDFWILLVVQGCGMGAATMLNNNMSQIGSSLGYTDTEITTQVSLWPIFTFTGMVVAGYASDWCLKQKGMARPILDVVSLAAGMAGNVIIAIAAFPGSLFVGSMLAAVSSGAQMSVTIATMSDLVGLRYLGKIMPFASLSIPLVTYVLNVKVASYFYDIKADEETGLCQGRACFGATLLITGAVNLVGCLLSLVLAFRTRHFYKAYSLHT